MEGTSHYLRLSLGEKRLFRAPTSYAATRGFRVEPGLHSQGNHTLPRLEPSWHWYVG